MTTIRAPVIVLTVCCLAYLVFLVHSATLLPERMATHFGFSGEADGWMDRSTNLMLYGALGLGLPLLFLILSRLAPIMPERFLNLPNKDYWLAPERRAGTCHHLSRQMLWLACLIVLFLASTQYLTIQANRVSPAQLPMPLFLTFVGAFLAGTGVWTFRLYRHFRRPS